MAIESKGYQVIHDMGAGLLIVKVQLDRVVEQDVNARIMKNEMQDQLTANIAKRGQLESLPLLAEIGNKIKIISGHHRIKSARQAGMKEISKVFGSNSIPSDAAGVISQALKKAEKEGVVTKKNRWQLIEYLCADYLGG